jgi:endo-1,4-beta-xylanase
MMTLTSIALGAVALASGALAFPFNATELEVRQITSSQTGSNGGYYYSFWNAGGGTVDY